MKWALEILELDGNADERAIKRAYARLLRSNRPDDDAEAFQQLHMAYQTALQWCRQQQQAPQPQPVATFEDAVGMHQQAALPVPADHASLHAELPAPMELALDGLPQQIIGAAGELDGDAFAEWLQQRPELWSLSAKQQIARPLAEMLFGDPELAMSRECFTVICDTFGWNEVDGPIDAYALLHLREQLQARWLLRDANELALLSELRSIGHAGITLAEVRKRRQLLTRPWQRLHALLRALDPARITAMKETVQVLAPDELVQAPLQVEQVRFWDDVSREDRLTGSRLQLGLLRGVLAGCLWLLLPLMVYWMEAAKPDKPTPDATPLLVLGAGGFLVILIIGIGWLPWKLGLHWLLAPQRRAIAIPVAAAAALGLIRFTDYDLLGCLLGAGTLWLSFAVTFRAQPNVIRFAPLVLFGVYLASSMLPGGLAASYGKVSAFLAVALSALDSWRQRRSSH